MLEEQKYTEKELSDYYEAMEKKHSVVYQAEPCLLWESAKVLAQERGLEMGNSCPLDNICTGHMCLMSTKKDEDRLGELRKELKEIRK